MSIDVSLDRSAKLVRITPWKHFDVTALTELVRVLDEQEIDPTFDLEFHLDARLDGLKAVTLTGKRYVVQDTFNWAFTISKASEETFAIVAHFIRVGEDGSLILGDDFYAYFRTHITANAAGTITAVSVRESDPLDSCQ